MLSDKSLLLNFLPVKTGGGLQNSLSFLSFLKDDPDLKDVSTVITYHGSEIYRTCVNSNIRVHSIKPSLISRLYFELFSAKKLICPNTVIFTLFGPPLITKKGSVAINGCAYSNLFYPEIGFWDFLPYTKRIFKHCIDFYRKASLLRVDEVIFETQILLDRARRDKSLAKKKLHLVEMSPSSLVSKENILSSVVLRYRQSIKDDFINFLYVAGSHPNKRHHLWPEIIFNLKVKGMNVRLVTTIAEGDYLDSLRKSFNELGISDHLINVGAVLPEHVASLVSIADGVTNTALLESFSNNFVEAWEMKKPLIVTDADWSRGCCGKGAIFIEPLEPVKAAGKILEHYESNGKLEQLLCNGNQQLNSLPSKLERYNLFKSIILRVLK